MVRQVASQANRQMALLFAQAVTAEAEPVRDPTWCIVGRAGNFSIYDAFVQCFPQCTTPVPCRKRTKGCTQMECNKELEKANFKRTRFRTRDENGNGTPNQYVWGSRRWRDPDNEDDWAWVSAWWPRLQLLAPGGSRLQLSDLAEILRTNRDYVVKTRNDFLMKFAPRPIEPLGPLAGSDPASPPKANQGRESTELASTNHTPSQEAQKETISAESQPTSVDQSINIIVPEQTTTCQETPMPQAPMQHYPMPQAPKPPASICHDSNTLRPAAMDCDEPTFQQAAGLPAPTLLQQAVATGPHPAHQQAMLQSASQQSTMPQLAPMPNQQAPTGQASAATPCTTSMHQEIPMPQPQHQPPRSSHLPALATAPTGPMPPLSIQEARMPQQQASPPQQQPPKPEQQALRLSQPSQQQILVDQPAPPMTEAALAHPPMPQTWLGPNAALSLSPQAPPQASPAVISTAVAPSLSPAKPIVGTGSSAFSVVKPKNLGLKLVGAHRPPGSCGVAYGAAPGVGGTHCAGSASIVPGAGGGPCGGSTLPPLHHQSQPTAISGASQPAGVVELGAASQTGSLGALNSESTGVGLWSPFTGAGMLGQLSPEAPQGLSTPAAMPSALTSAQQLFPFGAPLSASSLPERDASGGELGNDGGSAGMLALPKLKVPDMVVKFSRNVFNLNTTGLAHAHPLLFADLDAVAALAGADLNTLNCPPLPPGPAPGYFGPIQPVPA